MALYGKAMLINWSNVADEHRSQYYQWHDREHMEGRLRLPGFKRGRRFWAEEADRDVLNIYEVDDLEILTGPDYSKKASSPSPAYKSAGKIITDAIRALANVHFTSGSASGARVLTVRFELGEGSHAQALVDSLIPRLRDVEGVVGVHLCVADHDASSVLTADRVGRPTDVPAWSLLVEATIPEALARCRAQYLSKEQLESYGCVGPFAFGTYLLQMSMTKQDLGLV